MKKEHPLPELLAELKDFLALGLPGTAVTTDYPFQQRKLPPDRPVVWLGVEKLAASGSSFAPYLGEQGEAAVTGREVEVTLRLEILHRSDGNACYRVFGELCQRLLLEEGRPRVRESGAFRLVCRGALTGVLAQREESALPLREIQVKKTE